MPTFSDIVWDQPDTWQGIIADRTLRKKAKFETIVAEHGDYYHVINDLCLSQRRYWRTIGNHDTDLASTEYRDVVRTTRGIQWPTASDLFALKNQEGIVEYLFCHSHQFDASCTSDHAPYTGESLSQGGAWAYEGPDRAWNLLDDGAQFLEPWLDGSLPFDDKLVSAKTAGKDQTANAIWSVIGFDLHDRDKWEAIFTGNIAWEYFTNDDPQDAFDLEVEHGVLWLKLRHIDEHDIVDAMDKAWGVDAGPKLVLGHSHEPRINAARPAAYIDEHQIAPQYLNSAAAGRFENLIWGIEVLSGVPNMISWHRDLETDELVRTVWRTQFGSNGSELVPQSRSRHGDQVPPGYDASVQAAVDLMLSP